MKTVILYDTTESIAFYIVDGDYTRFEDIFVNVDYDDDAEKSALSDELAELDFNDEITTQQAKEYIRNGAELVLCGFYY